METSLVSGFVSLIRHRASLEPFMKLSWLLLFFVASSVLAQPTPAPSSGCLETCRQSCADTGRACGRSCNGDALCIDTCREQQLACRDFQCLSSCRNQGTAATCEACNTACRQRAKDCHWRCGRGPACRATCELEGRSCATNQCQFLCPPTAAPSPLPTFAPTTLAPTAAPTAPFKCFDDSLELYLAVNDYVAGNSSQKASVQALYGAAIGNWCTDKVSSFNNLFDSLVTFNEPLTNWNTSKYV